MQVTQRLGIVLLTLSLLAGCTRNLQSNLAAIDQSFADQRTAVRERDGSGFATAMSRTISMMRQTMGTIDALPEDQQLEAATAFAQAGEQGEKLYTTPAFKTFLDGKNLSQSQQKKIRSAFDTLKRMDLRGWMRGKRDAAAS
jgi:hypothetical protein